MYICDVFNQLLMETNNFLNQFPSKTDIENFNHSALSSIKSINEGRTYRMNNYLNCVDDYSWGGPCDKAADEHERRLKNAMQTLKEQLENGAPFVEKYSMNVLTDMDGNIVSEKIVSGRFGDCWLIKNGDNVSFVGCSKKQATYNKKGYKLMERVYELEFYYTTTQTKHGLLSVGRLLNENLQDVAEMPMFASTNLPAQLFFTLNKN